MTKSGIFNVLKPSGMTSHDVVYRIRKITGVKRTGHAGTLDPDAAGVLPVFFGNATRLIEYTASSDKCYRVHMLLGIKTDTGDDSGSIIAAKDNETLPLDSIKAVLKQYTGIIEQVPPMYSALKVNGQKLYRLARSGIEVERAARKITIHNILLIHYNKDEMFLEVYCSKGTYIRTLIEEIAESLGTLATVKFLLRTKSGCFSLENAAPLDDIRIDPARYLLSSDTAIGHLPKLVVTDNQAKRFCQGVKTTLKNDIIGTVCIYNNDNFIGIGKSDGEMIKPDKVFFQGV